MEFPQFLWGFIPIVEMIFGYATDWVREKPGIWLAVSVYFSVFRLFFRHFLPLLTLTIMYKFITRFHEFCNYESTIFFAIFFILQLSKSILIETKIWKKMLV